MRNSPVTRSAWDVLQRTIQDIRRDVLLLKNAHSPTVPVYLPDVPDDQIDGQIALVPIGETLDQTDTTVKPAWSFDDTWRSFGLPNWFWFRTSEERDHLDDSIPFNSLDRDLGSFYHDPGGRIYRATNWNISGAGFTTLDSGTEALVPGGLLEPNAGSFTITGSYLFHVSVTVTFPVQQEVREAAIFFTSAGFGETDPRVRIGGTTMFDLSVEDPAFATARTMTFESAFVVSGGALPCSFDFGEDDIGAPIIDPRDSATLSYDPILEVLAYRIDV